MKAKKTAFTLIELLVVIAIIAILAAILFPVFAQAREKARAITCVSNSKQITLSILMYAEDYDEMLPLSQVWTLPTVSPNLNDSTFSGILQPYVKNRQLFMCPDSSRVNPDPSFIGEIPDDGIHQTRTSYALNLDAGFMGFYFGPSSAGTSNGLLQIVGSGISGSEASIDKPAQLIAVVEKSDLETNWSLVRFWWIYSANVSFRKPHTGGATFSFCDGHVKHFIWGQTFGGVGSGCDTWLWTNCNDGGFTAASADYYRASDQAECQLLVPDCSDWYTGQGGPT